MNKLKNELQDHYQLYFPNGFVDELVKLGAKNIETSVEIIKANYLRKVTRYILNDYELVDSYGLVKFKGSILVIDPAKPLYSNGDERKFEGYVGMGAIDSLFKATNTELKKNIEIFHYGSSAVTSLKEGYKDIVTSEAKVMTLMGIIDNDSQKIYWGVGESSNALRSAVDSLLSAINRID
jgi:hypothetical protein